MKSTEWIQQSFVMNAMVSLCCNSLEAHERWLQKLCRLFSLRCQDQGEIVSFVSFREIDCRSAQTTASQHHSCKTLHFVSSPPQMIYRSVPPTNFVQIQQQMNFLVVVSKSQHKTTFINPLDSVFQTSCHSPLQWPSPPCSCRLPWSCWPPWGCSPSGQTGQDKKQIRPSYGFFLYSRSRWSAGPGVGDRCKVTPESGCCWGL